MNNIKTVAVFVLGMACGGGAVYFYLKDIYAKQSEEDIASAKEAFHAREEKLKEQIVELQEQLKPDVAVDVPPTVLANVQTPEKADISDVARAKYQQYTPPVPRGTPVEEPKADGIEAPYVISPEEFGEVGYTQVSLTLYADGILADEGMNIIDEPEDIVGDALDHFGEYEDDSVYCRSDPKKCDYEILKDLRRFADVRKSYPPNL